MALLAMLASAAIRRELMAARCTRSLSLIFASQPTLRSPGRTEQILAFMCPNAHAKRKLYPKRKPLCLGRHRGSFSALRELKRAYERIIFFRTPAVTANRADPRSTM